MFVLFSRIMSPDNKFVDGVVIRDCLCVFLVLGADAACTENLKQRSKIAPDCQ